MKHRLNQKGKIIVLIFLTTILCFLVGWGTISKEKTGSQQTAKIPSKPAEPLLLSFKPKKAFADSELDQSVQYQKELALEKTQHQKALEQLEKDHKNKVIYLTFDDGPSPAANQLLDILDHYHAKATFFMLGPNIQDHPSVVKRMVKEGFGVGLHSITHDPHKIYSANEAPLKEMSEDQRILQKVTGVRSQLVRLPYGSIPYLSMDMRMLLDQKGFKIWDWTVDSKDWELKNQRFVQKTIRDIQNMERAGQAPIVLMHDKPETIRYLPKLLTYLKHKGYKTKILTNQMPPYTFQCEGRCHSPFIAS